MGDAKKFPPTPGPWRVGRDGTVVCDQQHDGNHLMKSDGPGRPDVEFYDGYLLAESIAREADAALMASAPDLLRERDKARAERDRLATDALCALSAAGVATPEKGYVEEPHVLTANIQALARERDALAKFKDYVHERMDHAGVPTRPDGPTARRGAGSRIGWTCWSPSGTASAPTWPSTTRWLGTRWRPWRRRPCARPRRCNG